MKLRTLVGSLAVLGLASHAGAQTAEPQRITITGSSIKRIQSEGALPVQTITRIELERQGVVSAEQLIATLSTNGNGLDNLASNADVVSGQARGNNGATSANLRGQGSNATLILLNGRRVAAHGLNGGVVDLNQIPFSALERVEILKDGASSVYGTDAIGGVINFITRTDFSGLRARVLVDATEQGGGNLYTGSLAGGFGSLNKDGFNILATLAFSDAKRLRGSERNFVNTFQPERGLSPDTRGTPFATLQIPSTTATVRNVLTRPGAANGTGPQLPGTTTTLNGINVLDLPGGAGCASQPDMGPYDERIWAAGAGAQYGCAWDTGKAAIIQQPVKNTNALLRGTLKLGEHQLLGEYVFGRSESAKTFSANQISSGASNANLGLDNPANLLRPTVVPSPFRNLAYPSTGAGYNRVFNALVATFPELEVNRGQPMLFRWRCTVCGDRELETSTDTGRYLVALEGPLPFLTGWDYRTGASSAYSKSKSILGGGFHYMQGFANLINNGTLNPFLLAGESQTPAAIAALEGVSARGNTLYGGRFTMDQIDATASGPIFKLPGGEAMAAVGVDFRSEKYKFDAEPNTDVNRWVFNAPFDTLNGLSGVKRNVKAVYGEVVLPVIKGLEVNLSARHDEYSGFGSTDNPKLSLRYQPLESLVLRASYSTGFRVPTFNQLFNGVLEASFTGAGQVDPFACPARVVNSTPGNPCNAITFNTLFGGKSDLQPETAKMTNIGFVWQPVNEFSATVDWWTIQRKGAVKSLNVATIMNNYTLLPERFIRDPATGRIVFIDTIWMNSGESQTDGIEVSLRGNLPAMGGKVSAGLDGTYLLKKRTKLLTSSADFGPSEIGVFKRSDDLGIRWKHSAFVAYSHGHWIGTLSQRFAGGYAGYVPPGVANGSLAPTQWDPKVKSYSIFNLLGSYSGIKNLTLSAGVKNLFDTDPPFANSYDTNTGSGSSWEPRVGDPRGRSFVFTAEYKFF